MKRIREGYSLPPDCVGGNHRPIDTDPKTVLNLNILKVTE